ncbi:MAG: type II toxin-antitoxin system VapC family toxin [Sporichthyaceae bacterium]
MDSQVALWVLSDNPRLGAVARASIAESAAVHVCAASVWELTIKSMLGKLVVPAGVTELLEAQGLQVLDITGQHAEAIREFPELLRHDPFDRLLAAVALTDGLRLLTADRVLLSLGRDFVVDATV